MFSFEWASPSLNAVSIDARQCFAMDMDDDREYVVVFRSIYDGLNQFRFLIDDTDRRLVRKFSTESAAKRVATSRLRKRYKELELQEIWIVRLGFNADDELYSAWSRLHPDVWKAVNL